MERTHGPIRILHVDDDPSFTDLTTTFLERKLEQVTVESATNASEGLDRLVESAIDCIVSDYEMPGRTGIEFLEAVQADYPDLPFILFTGKGSEEIASEAISAGVTDYLQKKRGTDQYTILANRIRNAVERTFAQRERQRHLDAIETASEGIGILDEDGRFVYVNQTLADLYRYAPEEMLDEQWKLVYDTEQAREIREEVLPAVTETGYWDGETTGTRADGSSFIQDLTLATTDTAGLIYIVSDITDQKVRERQFEAIFNNTYTFMGLLDPDGTVLEVNDTALTFGGQAREQVIGTPVWETYWFQSCEKARTIAREAVERARNGESYQDEVRVQGSDRAAILDFTVRPIIDQRGDVTALVPEGHDITELKRRSQQFETLVENLPGVVYRCRNDSGWLMERIEGDAEGVTGYSPSTLETQAGIFGDELIHPDDRTEVRETMNRAIEHRESFGLTYRLVHKDGTTKRVLGRGQGIHSVQSDTAVLEGFVLDITTLQKLVENEEMSKI